MPDVESTKLIDAANHAKEAAMVDDLSKTADKMGVVQTPENVPEDDVTQLPKYLLPGKAYLALKWIALVLMPLLAITYPMLANIWGLQAGTQVSETCNIVALFIGVLIGVSQLKAKVGGTNA